MTAVEQPTALANAIDSYLVALEAEGKSINTVRTYGFVLRQLERFVAGLGCTRPEDLTPDMLRRVLAETMAQGRRRAAAGDRKTKGGEGEARMIHCAARGLAAFLRSDGVAMSDFKSVRRVKPPERIQPRLRLEDFAALLQAVERRHVCGYVPRMIATREDALIHFLADTGLRAFEVSRMNVADVDLDRGIVVVQQGKGRKPRVLSILDPNEAAGGPTIAALNAYVRERAARLKHLRRTSDALWIGFRGTRLSPGLLRDALRQLCLEAGLDTNRPPHAFRRGWFTASYQSAPSDLPVLAARMGWSDKSQNMIAVYTRGAELDLAAEPRPSLASRWQRQLGLGAVG